MTHLVSPSNYKGISWFIAHCLLFTLISLITKHLLGHLHLFEIVFFQTALGTLFIFPFVYSKLSLNDLNIFKWSKFISHGLRSFLWLSATIIFFSSINKVGLSKSIAISFTVPIFTTILAVLFLKERLYLKRFLALFIGLLGMYVIVEPGTSGYQIEAYVIILASFIWSITDIMIKIMGRKVAAKHNTFYFTLFSFLFMTPIVIFYWKMPYNDEWFWLLALGGLFVLNMISVTRSYQYADLTILMPFVFIQLVFVSIAAYFIFGEVIKESTIFGASLIILGTSYIAYSEKQSKNKKK